jgi:predicted O-linked N-acetylglucosamine transferase (SPINDLY family)
MRTAAEHQLAGRCREAADALRRALELDDTLPEAHWHLGNALLGMRQTGPALDVLQAAAARWPQAADAWFYLGRALSAGFRFQEAADAYRRAVQLVPGHLAALNNLGNALQTLGRPGEALEAFQEALGRYPEFLEACNNACSPARALGRLDLAAHLLRRAIAAHPRAAISHCNLGTILKDVGRMEEAVASLRTAVALDPGNPVAHSNLAYSLTFLPGCDNASILRENRAWDLAHALPRMPGPARDSAPDPGRRLRVGYVSPDFKDHCQAFFTLPLFTHHDHDRFEIFGYARVARGDALTARIAAQADVWRDTAALDDAEVADRVRSDRIDILVDLTMHMAGGRPRTFTRKPAPVQVAWLAYPGTTGLAAMDYRLTDPYLDPPGEHDDWYSETSIRLPDTFWCYDPLATGPLPGPLPALRRGYVTFGALNNFCKVNGAVLDLWARVLDAVPDSRLVLLAPPGEHRTRVLDRMAAAGVEPGRVEFAPFRPRADYLALYQGLDLGLDTFPYNGHTTSLDAFWMGVPVVTLVGGTVVGRAGWSQVCNLDLRELAAPSPAEFLRIAVALARDLPRLAQLRASLRGRMEASPLMDAPRFARNLEAAYRRMWRRWCLGRP